MIVTLATEDYSRSLSFLLDSYRLTNPNLLARIYCPAWKKSTFKKYVSRYSSYDFQAIPSPEGFSDINSICRGNILKLKVSVFRRAARELNIPLLWVDADSVVTQNIGPLLNDLEKSNYDLACTCRFNIRNPRRKFAAGAMWFARTESGQKAFDLFDHLCQTERGDHVFQDDRRIGFEWYNDQLALWKMYQILRPRVYQFSMAEHSLKKGNVAIIVSKKRRAAKSYGKLRCIIENKEKQEMTEPIRVFIGSDIYNIKAERALIYSIKKHASVPVEVNIMSRFGSNLIWKDWQHTDKWATCFSCFRWAIPAACGFKGKAIYLDSDMIVLSDIKELNDSNAITGIATTPQRSSSVTVFDCSCFASIPEFQLDHLKANAAHTGNYYSMLKKKGMVGFISQDWNCLDGSGFSPDKTKLIHYTELTTQPWHPVPHKFSYKTHPNSDMVEIWRKYYESSFEKDHTAEVIMQ